MTLRVIGALLGKEKRRMFIVRFSSACLAMCGLIVIGCATVRPVTPDGIKSEMDSIKREIARDRSYMQKLKTMKVGATGFFYVVDTNGTVVFHPQSTLIGVSFKNNWFMQGVIAGKSGCLTYRLGLRMYVILYEPLNASEILCLSILAGDMRALPAECVQAHGK